MSEFKAKIATNSINKPLYSPIWPHVTSIPETKTVTVEPDLSIKGITEKFVEKTEEYTKKCSENCYHIYVASNEDCPKVEQIHFDD